MNNPMELLFFVYGVAAIVGSIFAAGALERRLKLRSSASRPYRWGFYFGCMGLASAPLALVGILAMVEAGIKQTPQQFGFCLAYTLFFSLQAVCGWFIAQRKRWAWVLGSLFTFNIILWVIHYAYASRRWEEFAGQAYGSLGTEDEGYERLHDALELEMQGRIQEALTAYEHIAQRYSHTAAAHDAQKSIESLQARIA